MMKDKPSNESKGTEKPMPERFHRLAKEIIAEAEIGDEEFQKKIQ